MYIIYGGFMAGIKAEVKKVERLNVPLLIIGLGGTGIRALKQIKNALTERFENNKDGKLPYVEFWGIDADDNEVLGLHHTEYTNISMPLSGVVEHKMFHPEEKLWIDPTVIKDIDPGSGSGSIRQVSRFFFFRKFNEIKEKLNNKLTKIRTAEEDGADLGTPDIYLIHSVAGGTGSGSFLDLAMLIRHLSSDARVTDFIVMPDVSVKEGTTDGSPMANIFKSNSYAALKELDFWMRYHEHNTAFSVKYHDGTTVPWRVPFDRVVLLCSKKGTVFMPNIEKVIHKAIIENLVSYYSSENVHAGVFSYKSFESNIKNAYSFYSPQYPLNYRYSSISANTMELPITEMLKEQTKNVMMFVIEGLDEAGKVRLAEERLYTDLKLKEFMIKNNQGKPTVLGGNFENIYLTLPHHSIPPTLENGAGSFDRPFGDTLVSAGFSNTIMRNWVDSCKTIAGTSTLTWINSVKVAFEGLCKSIIIDEQQGPFALEYYVYGKGDKTTTLISILKEEYEKYKAMESTSNQQITLCLSEREELVKKYNHPSLVENIALSTGNSRVVEALMQNWVKYCKAIQVHNFAAKMADRLDKYILELEKFFKKQFSPFCEALLNIYRAARIENKDSEKDIISLNDNIREQLKNNFMLHKDLLIHQFFKSLSEGVFAIDEAQNTYVWSGHAMENHINEELNKVFKNAVGEFNIYNIDNLLQVSFPDESEQNKHIADLQKKLKSASTPLFAVDGATSFPPNLIVYDYISLPNNATIFNNTFTSLLKGNTEKKSSDVHDSVMMLQSYDGIYLNNFDYLSECQKAYAEKSACHIVSKNRMSKDFYDNWEVLPSIKPSYLFATAEKVGVEDNLYEETLRYVNEAIHTGMMEVNWGKDLATKPNHILMNFHLNKRNGIVESKEEMMETLNEIFVDNRTSVDSKLEKVKDYLFNDANVIALQEEDFTEEFAGVGDVPDPWQPGLTAGAREKLLEERFEYLKKYIAHVLLSRPVLNQQLQSQIEAFRYAKANTGNMQGEAEKWAAYVNFASEFYALILGGKLIELMDSSYAFVDLNGKRQAFEISDSIEKDLPAIVRVMMQLHDNKHVTPATFLLPEIEKFRDKLLYERFTKDEMKEAVVLYQTKYEDSLNKTIRALTYIDIAPTSKLQDPNLRKNVLSILERLKEAIETIVNSFAEIIQ